MKDIQRIDRIPPLGMVLQEPVGARRVVLILGAGATVADAAKRSVANRPPLDKGFFTASQRSTEAQQIAEYFKRIYEEDIFASEADSFEGVMARLYSDIYDPGIGKNAAAAFRSLVKLFNTRLATTTNNIKATQRRFLYRMLVRLFRQGIHARDVTIITFNQDLQIEKALDRLERTPAWQQHRPIFRFPSCYMLNLPPNRVTAPTGGTGRDLFPNDGPALAGIRVLKLHGSLNWYSVHRSQSPGPRQIFNPRRELRITRRRTIQLPMGLSGRRRRHTFPVIVPPVTHKAGVLHDVIRPLWSYAEDALRKANVIVIFGYSCPQLDFESSNLIRRSVRGNTANASISVIDPDPNVLRHYVELIRPPRVSYYQSAGHFLARAQTHSS